MKDEREEPILKLSNEKDTQSQQYSRHQKLSRYGSLNFRFLRSRSKSRTNQGKVFPSPDQSLSNPVNAFEIEQNVPKHIRIGMPVPFHDLEDTKTSQQRSSGVNWRRLSSGYYDELRKTQSPQDDMLMVGVIVNLLFESLVCMVCWKVYWANPSLVPSRLVLLYLCGSLYINLKHFII